MVDNVIIIIIVLVLISSHLIMRPEEWKKFKMLNAYILPYTTQHTQNNVHRHNNYRKRKLLKGNLKRKSWSWRGKALIF